VNAGEGQEPRALSALVALLKGAARQPTSPELERGLQALRARLPGQRSRTRPRLRWALLVASLTGVAALGVGVAAVFRERAATAPRPVALSRIEGGRLLEGGYLSASGNAGIGLYFDEGSQFILAPGTRGRLREVNADGARLAIEHGSASLRITESLQHRWSVESGPFLVKVKGTDFSVSWDPASERFEVRLRRGRVEVYGPTVGEGLALRPGQRLIVNLPKGETVISEEPFDREPAGAETSAHAPDSGIVGAAPSASVQAVLAVVPAGRASASASATGAERRWREALATGQWDSILSQADGDGIDATLRSASSDDLFALADAARYRRRTDLARATLLAQRSRFPNSARSLDAAFLLGRVEESRPSGRAQAISWYEEYLVRAPAGTYAAEALGRKMVLTKELGGAASARPIAEEYLRRFPEGSYAGAARAVRAFRGTNP
jgi:hypothetical protein